MNNNKIKDLIGIKYKLIDIYNKIEDPLINSLLYHVGYKIYKITNEVTGESYIGDTSESIDYRFHTAWHGGHFNGYVDGKHSLYRSMREYGLDNFTLEILPPVQGDKYRITTINPNIDTDDETYYINKFNSYYGGFNYSLTGKGYGKGNSVARDRRWMKDIDGHFHRIKLTEVQFKLTKGWTLDTPSKDKVYLVNESLKSVTCVDSSEVNSYLDTGWKLGNRLVNRVFMKSPKGTYHKINSTLVDTQLKLGWIIQSPPLGKVPMKLGDKSILVPSDEIESYESLGYIKEGSTKCRLTIKSPEGTYTRIKSTELQSYKDKGWVQEGASANTTSMKDPNGKFHRVNPNLVESRLKEGWIIRDPRKGWIYMQSPEGNFKLINPNNVETLLSQGWIKKSMRSGKYTYKDPTERNKNVVCTPGMEPEGYIRGRNIPLRSRVIEVLEILKSKNLEVNESNYNDHKLNLFTCPNFFIATKKFKDLF